MKRYECMIKETDCNKFFAERAKYIKYHGSLKTNIYKKRNYIQNLGGVEVILILHHW